MVRFDKIAGRHGFRKVIGGESVGCFRHLKEEPGDRRTGGKLGEELHLKRDSFAVLLAT